MQGLSHSLKSTEYANIHVAALLATSKPQSECHSVRPIYQHREVLCSQEKKQGKAVSRGRRIAGGVFKK